MPARKFNEGEYREIFNRARNAAFKAVEGLEENMRALNCGFAWVTIQGLRGNALKHVKEEQAAQKHWQKGVYIWASRVGGQDVDIKYKWASEFARILKEEGFEASADYRLD